MAITLPFRRDFDPPYGVAEQVSPLIRRIVAKNPSAFTFTGTGTYIVGKGEVAIIDPGPDMASHIDALLAALKGEKVSHILITHTHIDHSPAAAAIKAATGAATYGFGPHGSGRPAEGKSGGEDGDRNFIPDHRLHDGGIIEGKGWTIEVLHTPGHTSNHLCFALLEEKAIFTGDHVMGWSTSVISPPDGDMAAYMKSLRRLLERPEHIYWPTHGLAIEAPHAYVMMLIAHRRERETQILDSIKAGMTRIPDMVKHIYADVPAYLHPAAASSVLAHIIHMTETGRLSCDGEPSISNTYKVIK
jgi:glyoxylase-like metal-dependent hydrolase (beta-lactamase superfamily II)